MGGQSYRTGPHHFSNYIIVKLNTMQPQRQRLPFAGDRVRAAANSTTVVISDLLGLLQTLTPDCPPHSTIMELFGNAISAGVDMVTVHASNEFQSVREDGIIPFTGDFIVRHTIEVEEEEVKEKTAKGVALAAQKGEKQKRSRSEAEQTTPSKRAKKPREAKSMKSLFARDGLE
jgi:hypothetical protein